MAATVAIVGMGVTPASAVAPVAVLRLEGTGFGHGVGLSQWGAEYLARSGRSTNDILGTFYPGVQLGEATGPVRVAVHRPAGGTTTLTFPQGGEVRSALEGAQAAGFPVRVGPGGRVRIAYDRRFHVTALVQGQAVEATPYQEPCALLVICPATTTTGPPPTTTEPPPAESGGPGGGGGTSGGGSGGAAPPRHDAGGGSATASAAGPVVAVPANGGSTRVDDRGRSYRGVVEALADPGLRLVNLLGVEDYLRGMAEVPGTWPAAAVEAQTIAARTYALRAVQSSGEICDDARCQVYVGTTAETGGQDAAVAATARRVLAYDGALAAAVYSADAGGVSATTLEGFGTPDGVYPYLTTVPYETDNPLPWSRSVALSDLSARFGYPGTVTGARLGDTGPSARALTVVLEGSAGDRIIDGRSFARSLGLRSTRFTLGLGTADEVPELPSPGTDELQALPEEAGDLARQVVTPADAARLDRGADTAAAMTPASLPPGLDPRREVAAVAALLALAAALGAVTGAAAVDQPTRPVPAWARWRPPARNR